MQMSIHNNKNFRVDSTQMSVSSASLWRKTLAGYYDTMWTIILLVTLVGVQKILI